MLCARVGGKAGIGGEGKSSRSGMPDISGHYTHSIRTIAPYLNLHHGPHRAALEASVQVQLNLDS